MEKKSECIQKGKSNQVGARGQARERGQGTSASSWRGFMAHTFPRALGSL